MCACGSDMGSGPVPSSETIQQGTLITLEDGMLQGSSEDGVRRFAGIPYAQPPVGALRWKAPVRNDPWTGPRDATQFGGRCAQPSSAFSGAWTDNEDCLHLNVWTPDPAPTRLLPVMFWIHGGGNENGSTSDPVPFVVGRLFYDGATLAANHRVVVVSANYRLGVFGYFAHAALRQEGSPSGNQGLLDQRLALEWVRDNIAAFGGDPNNVTIFGESAGARNVCFHVAAPASRGLFHRAISESGECTGRIPLRDEAETQAQAYVDAVGCGGAADVLGCLRDKPADDLMVPVPLDGGAPGTVPGGAYYSGSTPRWQFRPIVDGDVIPKLPRDLFAEGAVARVPYIAGTNTEEAALFHLTTPPARTESDFLQALERAFGAFSARVAAAYPVAGFRRPNDALIRVSTDVRYACAVQDFAQRATAGGLRVYMYNFDAAYPIPGLTGLGPAHGAELTFVFGSLAADQWPAGGRQLSDLVQGYWSRFARAGDPTGSGAPAWRPFDPQRGNRLNLAIEPEEIEHFRAERCALWFEYYDTL